MKFTADKELLERVCVRLSSPLIIIIAPLFHVNPHELCGSPDQAAHYHKICPNLVASSLTLCLAALWLKVFWFRNEERGNEPLSSINNYERLD
jgi:hypothetical protein